MQIGKWTLKGFHQEEKNIALYILLTRKNIDALSGRPLGRKFRVRFGSFCEKYHKLEEEYDKGIVDHRVWANDLKNLATKLTSTST